MQSWILMISAILLHVGYAHKDDIWFANAVEYAMLIY